MKKQITRKNKNNKRKSETYKKNVNKTKKNKKSETILKMDKDSLSIFYFTKEFYVKSSRVTVMQ